VWDDGVDEYYKETQRTADTIFFGRTSYESLKEVVVFFGRAENALETGKQK